MHTARCCFNILVDDVLDQRTLTAADNTSDQSKLATPEHFAGYSQMVA